MLPIVFGNRRDAGRIFISRDGQLPGVVRFNYRGNTTMNLEDKKEAGAAGYILLWLLGIPIPILLLIFLLRGCT